MNRDDIIKMATEVWETPKWTEVQISRLERFFHMAQAAEREACAKECDKPWHVYALQAAIAIRARGQA